MGNHERKGIRSAGPADVAVIRTLMMSVPGFWDRSWRPDVLERVLASPDAITLVHEAQGEQINGFVAGHDVGFRAYLSELVVAPGSQRRGIGAALLAELEHRLRDRGCSILIADVWRDAEPFYRAQGWTPPPVILLRKWVAPPGAG
jgi:ribosomal protein S18 acetylase RimI-like enzyme